MNVPTECEIESINDCSSDYWARHFRGNRQSDWMIPWASAHELTAEEVGRIAASVAEFQRGESSEARGYLGKSAAFSSRVSDPVFHDVSILFVAEENQHAALLLRFMQQTGLPRQESAWGDSVFRWLRSWSDLGWASRVLIVAELIAQTYYPCLREATGHPVLRRICDKVISDEADHIRFQVRRIARVELTKNDWVLTVRDALQRMLMIGAAVVVYVSHGGVLRCRLNLRTFLDEVVRRNNRALRSIRFIRENLRNRNGVPAGLESSIPSPASPRTS